MHAHTCIFTQAHTCTNLLKCFPNTLYECKIKWLSTLFMASFKLYLQYLFNKSEALWRPACETFNHLILSLSLSLFQIDIQQVMLYCDPSLAIQEACCEIPGARVRLRTFTN